MYKFNTTFINYNKTHHSWVVSYLSQTYSVQIDRSFYNITNIDLVIIQMYNMIDKAISYNS